MSEDATPETEPAGSQEPPMQYPPTAVGGGASLPAPRHQRLSRGDGITVAALIEQFLDTLDAVGDTIARVAGLRRSSGPDS